MKPATLTQAPIAPPSPMPQDPLAQLRDIHLPQATGFWPPAPGWWLLAVLIITAIVVVLYLWLQHRRRNRYRRQAVAELKATQRDAQHTAEDLQQLNQLLKRTLLASPSAPPAAGLTGTRWLRFLDASGDTTEFTSGPGQLLAVHPYAERELTDAERQQIPQLVSAVKRWILTHQFSGRELPC